MKKLKKCVIFILISSLILPFSLFGAFQVSLSSRIIIPGQQLFFGRELAFQYGFQNSIFVLRLLNDSYDQFLYGRDIRWGLTGLIILLNGDFKLLSGAGASLSSAINAGQRLSLDWYIKAEYGWLYAEMDTLFFGDGLFNKYSLGLQWKIPISQQQAITPFIGFGGIMNTDYKKLLNLITITGGLMYEF